MESHDTSTGCCPNDRTAPAQRKATKRNILQALYLLFMMFFYNSLILQCKYRQFNKNGTIKRQENDFFGTRRRGNVLQIQRKRLLLQRNKVTGTPNKEDGCSVVCSNKKRKKNDKSNVDRRIGRLYGNMRTFPCREIGDAHGSGQLSALYPAGECDRVPIDRYSAGIGGEHTVHIYAAQPAAHNGILRWVHYVFHLLQRLVCTLNEQKQDVLCELLPGKHTPWIADGVVRTTDCADASVVGRLFPVASTAVGTAVAGETGTTGLTTRTKVRSVLYLVEQGGFGIP
jgi:hypothetical protein